MTRRKLFSMAGVFALFASVSMLAGYGVAAAVTPSAAMSVLHRKPAGLTQSGLAAMATGQVKAKVATLRPQANLTALANAQKLGQHNAASTLDLSFGLKLRHVAELKHFLHTLQNPRNANFQHFLTPAEFTRQYGPTKAQLAELKKFLGTFGITVSNVSPNRILVHTRGTTAAYEHALSVRINDYKLNDREFVSTSDTPQLPTAVAGLVSNVIGLDNAVLMRPMSHFKALSGKAMDPHAAAPPPATTSQFAPSQIAKAYDWPSITNTDNGAGVSVAIVTADSSGLASDDSPSTFWKAYNLPDHSIKVIPIDGDSGKTDGMGETLLDIELSGAMAPGIEQNVYVAGDAAVSTFTDAYNQVVNDNTSQVLTTSWGGPECLAPNSCDPEISTDNEIFMQAAAQGISVFAAAGDAGASDCSFSNCPPGDDNADFPSSDPYVTAANGTELTTKIDGQYVSEQAWSSTGGATSKVFLRPSWQTGPGIPNSDRLMNSDMAMNAGSLHPYVIYSRRQGWGGVYGTSAVAPELAALFAVGVSRQPGKISLGQSNVLIYNDVNAGNYSTDFHDITTGNNGTYQAGPDWDHPTGWGSPDATELLSHIGINGGGGTLQGTVKDSGGNPVSGATVKMSPGNAQGPTGMKGTYLLSLPVGSYTATVTAFGYQQGTASVDIQDGQKTTQDFTLAKTPTGTISGAVTDGSGHGYGLYAEIKVSSPAVGQVADVWTNPTTGQYSLDLPKGYKYVFSVYAAFDGYATGAATINDLSGDLTQNFPLQVTSTCSAPGYAFATGFGQDFNGSFPPAGWAVTNDLTNGSVEWELSSSEPSHNGNYTGGTGTAADADSNDAGASGNTGPYDTSLVSPPIPVTSLPPSPVLQYKASYAPFMYGMGVDALDLDISTDGGNTWTTISHWTSPHGTMYGLPGEDVKVGLGQYLPQTGNIQLRWRYYDLTSGWNFYAQVDDVAIGSCQPSPGGLVYGQVTDANTGNGLVGANVSDDTGSSMATVQNPSDKSFPVGAYLLFLPSGKRTLTAADNGYSTTSVQLDVVDNNVQTRNFKLGAGRFIATPGAIDTDVTVNGQKTKTVTIHNTGDAASRFNILAINTPAPASTGASVSASSMPLLNIKGHFTPESMVWAANHGQQNGVDRKDLQRGLMPQGGPWQGMPDLPIPVGDNAGATDPDTGIVYSVDGVAHNNYYNTLYAYSPKTDAWTQKADAPIAREAPVAAFLNGKLYVANGWGDSSVSNGAVAELDIYNPATDSWSLGAPNPLPTAGGSAAATLNGKLYILGGCDNGQCQHPRTALQVYDPNTDSWSSAADYPHSVSFASCGSINGELYCAGGVNNVSQQEYADGYVYDPTTDKWSPIADIPVAYGGLWASGYITSRNELLMSGGVTNDGQTITNAGFAYDPQTDTWSSLPNAAIASFRGASACGFYRFGGYTQMQFTPSVGGEVLPGYTPCGKPPSIPYITVSPSSQTIAAGASAKVTLTYDGTGQTEFDTSKSYLEVTGDTPYSAPIVALNTTWHPQPVALRVSANVDPDPVKKGQYAVFDVNVSNQTRQGDGAATQTDVSFQLPAGMAFVAQEGSDCTAVSNMVTCAVGDLAQGGSANVVVVTQASEAGKYSVTFTATAREPQDTTVDDTATVDGKVHAPNSGGGGGALGWLGLAGLLGLVLAGARIRGRRA